MIPILIHGWPISACLLELELPLMCSWVMTIPNFLAASWPPASTFILVLRHIALRNRILLDLTRLYRTLWCFAVAYR